MFLFPQCSSVCSFSHHQHQKGCAVNGSHVSSYDSNWCNNKCCIVQSRLRKLKLRIVKIYMLHHLILMSREPYYTRSLIGLFYYVMFKVNTLSDKISSDKIFDGQNISSDKTFDTKPKFRQFCPIFA